MATIKSFTSLEQSKKLIEILPLESADMYLWSSGKRYYIEAMDDGDFNEEEGHVCAWSLSALLGVLPNDTSLLYFDDAYQMVYDKKPYVISNKFDNPVDACVAMIELLHKQKLL